jgi:hypothetical protein
MAFSTLKFGNVTQINRMLKCPVTLMTFSTFVFFLSAKINRMLKIAVRWNNCLSSESLVKRRMANIALGSDRLTLGAQMPSVMTSVTALRIVMPDIVRMALPIGLHRRKEIRRVYPSELYHRGIH